MAALTFVAARPDGDFLAVASDAGWLGIWLPIDNRIVTAHALDSFINKVGWTADGSHLIATVDDSLVVLSADGKDRISTIPTGHDQLRTFAVHPTQPIVATTGGDGAVRLWDLATGKQRNEVMARQGQGSGGGTALALSADSIVVGYASGFFATCDYEGKNVGAAELFGGGVSALAYLPARSSFIAGGSRGSLIQLVIEPETWRVAQKWSDPPKPIATNTIDVASDGRFIAACSDDTALLFEGTQTISADRLGSAFWLERKEWSRDYIVSAACFVPKTPVIATSHFTGCIKLWHAERTYRFLEVRFENDQPVWRRDGEIVDPIGKWSQLE